MDSKRDTTRGEDRILCFSISPPLRRNALNERFKGFFAEVKDAFQFLEQVYNYQRLRELLTAPHEWRDTIAKLRYVGQEVGVQIEWYWANATIRVTFLELLKERVFPRRYSFFQTHRSEKHNMSPAIDLKDLVEVLGQKAQGDFLLYYGRNERAHDKCLKIIEEKRQEVIAGLARATQTYATPILQGDTTLFPEVVKYARAKQKKDFPDWNLPADLP